MAPQASRPRGRPRIALSDEERRARELALHRQRTQRYYQRRQRQALAPQEGQDASTQPGAIAFEYVHFQPHPPALPSNTDPTIGLHIDPNLAIPVPDQEERVPPPPAEITIRQQEAPAPESTRPVWNQFENPRTTQPAQSEGRERNHLFENSQAQLTIVANGGDTADAVVVEGQANAAQHGARDEELQGLVDTVNQLLITPHSRPQSGWLSVVLL